MNIIFRFKQICPLLLLFFSPIIVSAETKDSGKEVTIYQYAKKINLELDQLKDYSPTVFINSIDTIRMKLEKYLDHKKRVCQGEFSTLVLMGQNNLNFKKKKRRRKVRLSKKEKNICYLEMKSMHTKYLKNSYEARKRFIIKMHEVQLKELESKKDKALLNLQKTFY